MLAPMSGRGRQLVLASATWLLAGLGCGGDPPLAAETDDGSSSTGPALDGSSTGLPEPSACAPGQAQACYDGPLGTEGVGACAAGQQVCAADGRGWSACEGQVLPAPAERCDTPHDDDCDGLSVCQPALEWWHEVPGYLTNVAARADGGVVLAGSGGYDVFQGEALAGFFVVELDASGRRSWSHSVGPHAYAWPEALAVDATGASVVAGVYDGNPDFGGGPLPAVFGLGGFAVRYDEGVHAWSRSDFRGGVGAVALGSDGTAYLVGAGHVESFSASLAIEAVAVDGTVTWVLLGEGAWDLSPSSLVLAPTGPGGEAELLLVARVASSAAMVGDLPIPAESAFEPFVVRIGLDGTPRGHQRLLDPRALVTYEVRAFGRPGGLVTAATVLQLDPEGGAGAGLGVLLTALDDALTPVSQHFLGRDTWLNGIAPYPGGTTLLTVDFANVLELGQLGVGEGGSVLALVDDQGHARWAEVLYALGGHQLSSAAAAPAGAVYVVGRAIEGGVLAGSYVSGPFVAKLRP
jgi:hypothetical protein